MGCETQLQVGKATMFFLCFRVRALDSGRALPEKNIFSLPSARIRLLLISEKKIISGDKKKFILGYKKTHFSSYGFILLVFFRPH